ncbi:hypothetical protein ACW9ID_11295 [Pseudomonas gingeri]
MKPSACTQQQLELLKLPIVITADVWSEAVDIDRQPSIAKHGFRLSSVLHAAYSAIVFKTWVEVPPYFDFSLDHFAPWTCQSGATWLDLRLLVVHDEETPIALKIMLRREALVADTPTPQLH